MPVSALDRAVRRLTRHFGSDEGLLGTALGHEAEGRRRLVVVATDRRMLVSNLRFDPPTEIAYSDLRDVEVYGEPAAPTLRLVLAEGEQVIARIGDVDRLALLVALLRERIGAPAIRPSVPLVRVS